jgi:hypothetical protein
LAVTSNSTGWSAQAYLSSTPIANNQAVTAWGAPKATMTAIPGDVTFDLGGRSARYVLLWITNLGPEHQVNVNACQVT